MPLDQHVSALIAGLEQQGVPAFHEMSAAQARETIDSFTGLQLPAEPVAHVDAAVYHSDGADLAMRIHVPAEGESHSRPVILYFHGGGFVAGGLDVVDEPARAVANSTGAVVVTAQYRLAPEHRFPAAHDDAWAALHRVREVIAGHDGDPERIILMGDSAGGNLVAATALRARDAGIGLAGQILIYPTLDPDAHTASRAEFADGYLITAADMDHFWRSYLNGPADAQNPSVAPLRAVDLAGLPPTLVLTMEYEVLRDEAEDYGRRLTEAGVETRTVRFDGLVHGVFWLSGAVPRCVELREAIAAFVGELITELAAT